STSRCWRNLGTPTGTFVTSLGEVTIPGVDERGPMANDDPRPILVCVDGSDASTDAAAAGLALIGGDPRVIVVTVAEETDPMLVTGSGFAGPVMTREELQALDDNAEKQSFAVAEQAAATLGISDADVRVVRGDPGRAL